MSHLDRTLIFRLLLLAGLLSACGLAPSTQVAPTSTPTIQLQPCKLGYTEAQCGTLKVYENRAARSGRMIELRVAVIKATAPNPSPDPIFYLAGGPGGAATEDAAKTPQFPFSLSDTHDLVFVDQRGTGGSNRVLIPPSPDISGLTQAEMESKLKTWAAKVVQEMDMDPRFYTTSVAMDDLDEVRQALGYDKINLFGHSYGATAAQYYLRQHEEHLRSVVLSGGSLLDIPVFELWTQNGQRALDFIFTLCQADSTCQAAYPNLRAEFKSILASLEKQPMTDPSSGVTFSAELMAETIRVITLDASNWVRLPLLIHKAYQENDWTGLIRSFETYGAADWSSQMMEHVIRCSEKWAAFDPNKVATLSEGSYLKGWYVSLAQNHALACSLTPPGETPEGTDPQPKSMVPVLIFNGEEDPQNPPENMAGSKELWPNSLLVVEPYQGHWLSNTVEIYCRWSIMSDFIQSASVLGLNTDCLRTVKQPAFLTPFPQPVPTQTAANPTPTLSAAASRPVLKTAAGDFVIESIRWVDENNGTKPGSDEKTLLITLGKPGQPKLDLSNFSADGFVKALRDAGVRITWADGSYVVCTTAGWVGDTNQEFGITVHIPRSATKLQLFWPGNPPIELIPGNQEKP